MRVPERPDFVIRSCSGFAGGACGAIGDVSGCSENASETDRGEHQHEGPGENEMRRFCFHCWNVDIRGRSTSTGMIMLLLLEAIKWIDSAASAEM